MARPPHLIDINGIASLASIVVDDNVVRIGACVRHAAFGLPEAVPGPTGVLLSKVMRNIAHPPIRARGTFCGSIANADPSSEWLCATAALDGHIITQSRRGERRVPAADFFQGVMTTDLQDDEMVTAVELPLLPAGTRSGFVEFSRRKGDFAIAMALAIYRIDGGHATDVRIAVGGVEPAPRRIVKAEAALSGAPAGPGAFTAAAEAVADAVDPMEDEQITADFRHLLVRVLTRRALENAA
jgi:carbon-monoxide dehydrogenase medium subunit